MGTQSNVSSANTGFSRDNQYPEVRPEFQNRKNLAEHVRDNMSRAFRQTYMQRIIMIAKHKDKGEKFLEMLETSLKQIITNVTKSCSSEPLSGLFLFYSIYSIYMIEGSEEIVGPFCQMLLSVESNLFLGTKVVLVYNNINQTFFNKIIWRTAMPAALLDTTKTNAIDTVEQQSTAVIKKIYDLCKKIRSDPDYDNNTEDQMRPTKYNKFLPDLATNDFLLASDKFPNLSKFSDTFNAVLAFSSYDEGIWPVPYDFAPRSIFATELYQVNLTFGKYKNTPQIQNKAHMPLTNIRSYEEIINQQLFVSTSEGSWGTPGSGQYHIQTDEGPERYFRYQTDNGQYRKEKRLKDGTVIGTDAWIDALGYLRQKDYIADHEGYRILKSKTVFVGRGRPIEEAIKSIKKVPAQAGELSKSSYNSFSSSKPVAIQSTTAAPSFDTTPIAISVSHLNSIGDEPAHVPKVFVRPHSQPIDKTYIPAFDYLSTTTAFPYSTKIYSSSTENPLRVPSLVYEPPYGNDHEPIAVYPPSSTPSPISADYGSPIAIYSTTSTPTSSSARTEISSTISPIIVNSLDDGLLPPRLPSDNSGHSEHPDISANSFSRLQTISSTTARPAALPKVNTISPVNSNNVDIQPIYSRGPSPPSPPGVYKYYHPSQVPNYNNNIGSGYENQFPLYDGVSISNNGFRYYLPRQYHEEENSNSQRRSGSFGYIDPFGIRRVVYYNTAPGEGFVHRKNNRYVGFDATPYDPRPL